MFINHHSAFSVNPFCSLRPLSKILSFVEGRLCGALSRLKRIPIPVGMMLLGCLVLSACRRTGMPGAPRWSNWSDWGYQSSRTRPQGGFNVSFVPEGDATGRTRIAFCVQDERNHYFLELNADACYFGLAEAGVERPLVPLGASLSELIGRRVVIERRALRIGAVVDDELKASLDDGRFRDGKVACGGRSSRLKLGAFRVRSLGEIYFADDFMRTQEEAGPWTTVSGKWEIKTIRNPGLSINAFSYVGIGKPGVAVTGYPFWSDVEFSVACRPRGSAVVGVYVAYRDATDYYLMRWRGRADKHPGAEFVRCKDGVETVLSRSNVGHLGDQWYRISVWYGGGWARVRVDDTSLFEVADSGLTMGQVGLHAESEAGVEFDDVRVQGAVAFADDFGRNGDGRWTAQGGTWRYLAEGAPWFRQAAPRRLLVDAGPTALKVAGDADWRDYVLSADVGPWDKGALGLAFSLVDGSDYYSAEWDGAELAICKTAAGRREVLASTKVGKPRDPVRLSVRHEQGSIRLDVDGRTAVAASDQEWSGGKVALLARDTGLGVFDNVSVRFLPPVKPLLTIHEVFSSETSMSAWSDALRDWQVQRADSATATGSPTEASRTVRDATCWHRSAVFGDCRIDLKLPDPPGPGSSVEILAAGDGGTPSSGYALSVRRERDPKEDGGKTCVLKLTRQGDTVAETPFPWASGLQDFSLLRSGPFLSGSIGGRESLSWKDPEPLRCGRVGVKTVAHPVDLMAFNIFSRNVRSYTFQTAPTDWREAGGTWEVTNRWQCDPRWSFFSGRGDSDVVLWNKRRFLGDMTLEFFAATKMDRERGSRYEYASDINATICADGRDLTSGYSFVFGGHNNTSTRIYRGTTVLAENTEKLIAPPPGQGSLHRYWFYIRIMRRGRQLELSIDGETVLSVEDPRPLPGGHLALWTHDNGVMVGRVRVSAEEISDRESPAVDVPAICRTIYSPKPPTGTPPPLAAVR